MRSVRPTVGCLVDYIEDGYQLGVIAGVRQAAIEHDANLLVLSGGVLGAHALRNTLFETVQAGVDALIVLSGPLSNYLGPEALGEYCQRFVTIPLVSIGQDLGGVPNVHIDNAQAMREAVTHLIEVHGRRRIAFVRGPEVSMDAEHRFQGYHETLADYGVAYDPSLVIKGQFGEGSGVRAVADLLDDRKVRFDALAAANDSIASGAIRELVRRRVRVPEDVAVIGFDDMESSQYRQIPMASVRQPLAYQGRTALELAVRSCTGEDVERVTLLPTVLQPRQSCGCSPLRISPRTSNSLPVSDESPAARIGRLAADLAPRLMKAAGASATGADGEWAERLVLSFAQQLKGAGRLVFLGEFAATLNAAAPDDPNAGTWHAVIAALRNGVIPFVSHDADLLALCEDMWHDAQTMVTGYAERLQAERRIAQVELLNSVVRMSETVSEAADRNVLFDHLAGYLDRFEIPSCFIVLYDGPPGTDSEARLAFAWDGHRHTSVPHFRRDLLPPASMLPERRYTFDVEALCHRGAFLGYAMFERTARSPDVSQALRNLLSASLGTLARTGTSDAPGPRSIRPSVRP